MDNTESKKNFYKRWYFWVIVGVIIIILVALRTGSPKSNGNAALDNGNATQNVAVKLPEYEVLAKHQTIQSKMSGDTPNYFGGVLIKSGEVMDIPPKEFEKIAKKIAQKEHITAGAAFYSTLNSYKANTSLYVPIENKANIEKAGGIKPDQEYISQEKINKYLNDGYIGEFKDGKFSMLPGTHYYKLHHQDDK